jgi:hypothetical protein
VSALTSVQMLNTDSNELLSSVVVVVSLISMCQVDYVLTLIQLLVLLSDVSLSMQSRVLSGMDTNFHLTSAAPSPTLGEDRSKSTPPLLLSLHH